MKPILQILFLCFALQCSSQNLYYYGYDTNWSYYPTDFIQTSDGGFYMVGAASQNPPPIEAINIFQYLVKVNSNGDTIWTRNYQDDFVNTVSVIQKSDSSFISIGNTDGVYICNGVGSIWPYSDFFVQEIAKTSDSISWVRHHEQCGNGIASTMKPDNNSIYLQFNFFNTTSSKEIRKFDVTGVFTSSTTINPSIAWFSGFEPAPNGFYIARYDSLYKISNTGNVIRSNPISCKPYFMDFCRAEDENLVFACASNDGAYPDTATVMKTDSLGVLAWRTPVKMRAQHIFMHSSGNYIVTGQYNDSLVVLALQPNGNMLWCKTVQAYDRVFAVKSIELQDGGVAAIAHVGGYAVAGQYALFLIPGNTVGVDNEKAEIDFSISPNPTRSTLLINLNSSPKTNLNLEITNLSGQIIWSYPIEKSHEQISLNIPSGMYLCALYEGSKFLGRKKVIVMQ